MGIDSNVIELDCFTLIFYFYFSLQYCRISEIYTNMHVRTPNGEVQTFSVFLKLLEWQKWPCRDFFLLGNQHPIQDMDKSVRNMNVIVRTGSIINFPYKLSRVPLFGHRNAFQSALYHIPFLFLLFFFGSCKK